LPFESETSVPVGPLPLAPAKENRTFSVACALVATARIREAMERTREQEFLIGLNLQFCPSGEDFLCVAVGCHGSVEGCFPSIYPRQRLHKLA
jgi:hypothetical protein